MTEQQPLKTLDAWRQNRWREAKCAWWALLAVVALGFLAGVALAARDPIEYLRVFLAWPPIAAFIAVVFLLRFREPIGRWIENLQIQTRGGYIIGPQRPGPAHIPEPVPTTTTAAASEDEIALPHLEADVKHWKFLYYSAFYVQKTKSLLWFLNKTGRVSISFLASMFPGFGQGPGSPLDVMLGVLNEGGMITIAHGFVDITATGNEFVEFLLELGESSPS